VNVDGASTTAVITIAVPRDWFFWWFLSVDLSKIMHRYGVLPSVVATRGQTGPMHVAGSSRVIQFSDGSTAVEEVTSCDPPRKVIYRVRELTSMFRHLVTEGRGEITFQESPTGGTAVEWRYTFAGRNLAATLLLRPLVSSIWRGYMRSALSRAKHLAEAEVPSRSP